MAARTATDRPPTPRSDPADTDPAATDRVVDAYLDADDAMWLRIIARSFGEEYAKLMRLPLAESWQKLEALALQGDSKAAELLAFHSLRCTPVDRTAGMVLATKVMASDARFVEAEYRLRGRREVRHAAECRRLAIGPARLASLQQQEGFAPELAVPSDDPLDLDSWRDAGGTLPDSVIAETIARTSEDPEQMDRYALCATIDCSSWARGMPPPTDAWIAHAAALGSPAAIAATSARLQEAGDVTSAYAWTRFRLWLRLQGCAVVTGDSDLFSPMYDSARIAVGFAPGQRASADAAARRLIDTHGDVARAFQGCAT